MSTTNLNTSNGADEAAIAALIPFFVFMMRIMRIISETLVRAVCLLADEVEGSNFNVRAGANGALHVPATQQATSANDLSQQQQQQHTATGSDATPDDRTIPGEFANGERWYVVFVGLDVGVYDNLYVSAPSSNMRQWH